MQKGAGFERSRELTPCEVVPARSFDGSAAAHCCPGLQQAEKKGGLSCTLFSVGPPPNKWGTLFNIRQDVAACKYNTTSTDSSYLNSNWLVPEGPNSMSGPPSQAIA